MSKTRRYTPDYTTETRAAVRPSKRRSTLDDLDYQDDLRDGLRALQGRPVVLVSLAGQSDREQGRH